MEDHSHLDHERNERERKQTYLINQIVIKGYNKADFATFMNNLKANGTDIDLWTFDELVEAVERFQLEQTQCPKSPEKVSQEDESSEDEEMYKYLHPSEVEKIKQRNQQNLNRLNTTLPVKTTTGLSQPLIEPRQSNNDQSGWEKDDIDIEFLNENYTDTLQHEEIKIDDSDKKTPVKVSKKKRKHKQDNINITKEKSNEQSDEFVEKALEDFFKNEDSDYDVIKSNMMNTVSNTKQVEKLMDQMTPPSEKKPRYNMRKMKAEQEEPGSIHSFIAEVK